MHQGSPNFGPFCLNIAVICTIVVYFLMFFIQHVFPPKNTRFPVIFINMQESTVSVLES